MRRVLAIIEEALAAVDATISDVVRTRIHLRSFADLVLPEMCVYVEAEAVTGARAVAVGDRAAGAGRRPDQSR